MRMYINRIFLLNFILIALMTGSVYAESSDTITSLASKEYVDAYVDVATENMQTTDNMKDVEATELNIENYSTDSAKWNKETLYPSVNTVETIAQYFVNKDLLHVAGDVTSGMLLTINGENANELIEAKVEADNIAENAVTFDKLAVPEACQASSNQCLLGVRSTKDGWELYWEVITTAADIPNS